MPINYVYKTPEVEDDQDPSILRNGIADAAQATLGTGATLAAGAQAAGDEIGSPAISSLADFMRSALKYGQHEAQGAMDDGGRTLLSSAVTSPEFLQHPVVGTFLKAIDMAPSVAASLLPLAFSEGLSGPAGVAAGGGMLGFSQSADDTYAQLNEKSDDELKQIPFYRDLRQHDDEETARSKLAVHTMGLKPLLNAVASAGAMVLGPAGRVMGALPEAAGSGLLKRAGVGALEGVAGGAAMGGVAEATHQQTEIDLDQRTQLDPSLIFAAAADAGVTQGVMGAVGGAFTKHPPTPADMRSGIHQVDSRSPDAAQTLALGGEPETAPAPAAEPSAEEPSFTTNPAKIADEHAAEVSSLEAQGTQAAAANLSSDAGQTVPEAPATLAAQMEQLANKQRRAVLFPKNGDEPPPETPAGMKRMVTKDGVFIYDPDQLKYKDIIAASKAKELNKVLDLGDFSKKDLEPRIAAGEAPVAVTERAPDGTEVKAAAGTDQTAPAQVDSLEASKTPGNTVQVEQPGTVLNDRVAAAKAAGDALRQKTEAAPPAPPKPVEKPAARLAPKKAQVAQEPALKAHAPLAELPPEVRADIDIQLDRIRRQAESMEAAGTPVKGGVDGFMTRKRDELIAKAQFERGIVPKEQAAPRAKATEKNEGRHTGKPEREARAKNNATAAEVIDQHLPRSAESLQDVAARAQAMLAAASEAKVKLPDRIKDITDESYRHNHAITLLMEARDLLRSKGTVDDVDRFLSRESLLREGGEEGHKSVIETRRVEGDAKMAQKRVNDSIVTVDKKANPEEAVVEHQEAPEGHEDLAEAENVSDEPSDVSEEDESEEGPRFEDGRERTPVALKGNEVIAGKDKTGTFKVETKKVRNRIVPERANRAESNDISPAQAGSMMRVEKAVEGKSIHEVADFIMKTAPSMAHRLVARALIPVLKRLEATGTKFEFHVAHIGDQVPVGLIGARGISNWHAARNTSAVWVNGSDVRGSEGTTFETILHELVHAATQRAIYAGKLDVRGSALNAKARQLRKELIAVGDAATKAFNAKAALYRDGRLNAFNDFEKQAYEGRNNAFRNEDEVLAWGMTNHDMQEFLESIPYRSGNLFSGFVDSIRKFLGLPEKGYTALSEVIRIHDELMKIDQQDVADHIDDISQRMGWKKGGTNPQQRGLPDKITKADMQRLKEQGYKFREATLYSPQHTTDPVVRVESIAGTHPYHYVAPEAHLGDFGPENTNAQVNEINDIFKDPLTASLSRAGDRITEGTKDLMALATDPAKMMASTIAGAKSTGGIVSKALRAVTTNTQYVDRPEIKALLPMAREITDNVERSGVYANKLKDDGLDIAGALIRAQKSNPGAFAEFSKLINDQTMLGADASTELGKGRNSHLTLSKAVQDKIAKGASPASLAHEGAMVNWQARAAHADLARRYQALVKLNPDFAPLQDKLFKYYDEAQQAMGVGQVDSILRNFGYKGTEAERAADAHKYFNEKLSPDDRTALAAKMDKGEDALSAMDDVRALKVTKGPYAPQMRRGEHAVVGRYKVATPANGVKVDDSTFEFKTRKEAHDFSLKQDLHPEASKVWYDSATGKRVKNREDAISQTGQPIERYHVRLQTGHLEFRETEAEARARADELQKSGLFEKIGAEQRRHILSENSEFTGRGTETLLRKLAQQDTYQNATELERKALRDTIKEASISAMSENRVQSRRIPRRFVQGASDDIARGLFDYNNSQANFRAKLKYRQSIDDGLKAMWDHVKAKSGSADNYERSAAANEIEKRARAEDPNQYAGKYTEWTRRVMTWSYIDRMARASHLILHQTHLPMITSPYMAGRHGLMGSYGATLKAWKELTGAYSAGGHDAWASLVGSPLQKMVDHTQLAKDMTAKAPDGKRVAKMFDELAEIGLIHPSSGMEVGKYLPSKQAGGILGGLDRGMQKVDTIFRQLTNATEAINRHAGALAAYRLEFSKLTREGKSEAAAHEGAVEYARQTIHDTQGQFSATNAGPLFKNKFLRPFLQFKQFPQMMYHLIGKLATTALKGETREAKIQALSSLGAILGAHMAMAGVIQGLPLEPFKILGAISKGLGLTSGDWTDVEQAVTRSVNNNLGKDLGAVVTRGLGAQMGVDVHHRLGLNSFLTYGMPDQLDSKSTSEFLMNAVLGAPGGMVSDALKGTNKMLNGDVTDGALQAFPLQAFRDARNAINPPANQYDYTATGADRVKSALGFTPAAKAEASEKKEAIYNATQQYDQQRGAFIKGWTSAAPGEREAVWEKIRNWNTGKPQAAQINKGDLFKSLAASQKAQASGKSLDHIRLNTHNEDSARAAADLYR